MASQKGETLPSESWLKQSQKRWVILAQGAVWVLGILGGFLAPPPVGIGEGEENTWLRLAQFIIAVVVGLVVIAGMKWKQTRHTKAWWATSFLFLAIAILAFFRYQQLLYAHTVSYDEKPRVIGTELTEVGRSYHAENPDLSDEMLVMHFAGKVEDVWTKESVNRNKLTLAGIYILCLPLFTVCLLGILQAVQCMSASAKAGKADKETG